MENSNVHIKGRFAPSPTGRMHAGNIFSALMAWLVAKSQGGTMVLRVEDLDRERSKPQFIDAVQRDFETLGLTWDEGPYFQHNRDEAYQAAFDSLVRNGKVRVLGGSNYDTWRFMEANAVAAAHDYAGFEVMQQRFSYLAERGDVKPKYAFNEFTGRERLRYLAAKNIPLVAYSCLCKGGYEKPERMPSTCVTGARLDKIREFAAEKGISVSAAVVAYLTNLGKADGMPTVIPLFSSSNPEHFIENLRGADVTLTVEELEMLINA